MSNTEAVPDAEAMHATIVGHWELCDCNGVHHEDDDDDDPYVESSSVGVSGRVPAV